MWLLEFVQKINSYGFNWKQIISFYYEIKIWSRSNNRIFWFEFGSVSNGLWLFDAIDHLMMIGSVLGTFYQKSSW